jgi:hypothetical protein
MSIQTLPFLIGVARNVVSSGSVPPQGTNPVYIGMTGFFFDSSGGFTSSRLRLRWMMFFFRIRPNLDLSPFRSDMIFSLLSTIICCNSMKYDCGGGPHIHPGFIAWTYVDLDNLFWFTILNS